MTRRRRIEITVENRLLVVRRSAQDPVWCVECPAPVQMISPEAAAAVIGESARAIYRQVEAGQFHFLETPDGRLLICPDSLISGGGLQPFDDQSWFRKGRETMQGKPSLISAPLGWQPILTGALSERAWNVVNEIAECLKTPPPVPIPRDIADPTAYQAVRESDLACGRAGIATLFAYLSKVRADHADDETAARLLNDAIEAVAGLRMSAALYGGFTGIAWAAEHYQRLISDENAEDCNEATDEALLTLLNQSRWQSDYDLVSGLVGLGVYALERLPQPSAVACLALIVKHLDELAKREDDGVTWLTSPEQLPDWQRELCPNGYYNLGLAHGAPGAIALLGEICAAGIAVEKSRSLLDGAVAWLLRQRIPGNRRSHFPTWVAPGLEPDESRSAWCYGDLGLAAALLTAARSVQQPEWEDAALDLARRPAQIPFEHSGINDAGLCHGAAGVAHIFNRIFQASGEAVFKEAAQTWFTHALSLRHPGRGVAGFAAFTQAVTEAETWAAEPGLLTGAAGIALALLAAITPIEPKWDHMLLTSIPVR